MSCERTSGSAFEARCHTSRHEDVLDHSRSLHARSQFTVVPQLRADATKSRWKPWILLVSRALRAVPRGTCDGTTASPRLRSIVTREQLRQKLWPKDTFVDVDNSVNAAINRLREALGDSAESPRYVETLPRRGYRFVAPVTEVSTSDRGSGFANASSEIPQKERPVPSQAQGIVESAVPATQKKLVSTRLIVLLGIVAMVVLGSILWLAILFALTMGDYLMRAWRAL